jgi:hypothetical protein
VTSNIERLISKAECAYTGKKPAELMLTVDQGFELLFSLQFSGQMKAYSHLVPDTEVRQTLQSHDESKLRAIFDLVPYNSHKIVIVQSAFPKLREQPLQFTIYDEASPIPEKIWDAIDHATVSTPNGENKFWYQRSLNNVHATPDTAPAPTKLKPEELTLDEEQACRFGSESAAEGFSKHAPEGMIGRARQFGVHYVAAFYIVVETEEVTFNKFQGWLKK